jgi:hypothetical protein
MDSLTIVSSCHGYGKYLADWAESITRLTVKPGAVRLFTHGSDEDAKAGAAAIMRLSAEGLDALHVHQPERLDFGTARNRAVAMSSSEWVMHLDCDDQIMPHALAVFQRIAPKADVIGAGYERSGDLRAGPHNRKRIYEPADGLEALNSAAPCSGVSPFRRSFWERSPYRTDMRGAWDTALWIGFAKLGARFRPTDMPVFWYRQHSDSIFNRRRKVVDWTHRLTTAQLRCLRRYSGVSLIVPRDRGEEASRLAGWDCLRRHYARHHPDWEVVEGFSSSASWSKGEAIADALTRSTAAVLVVADADCLIPPAQLEASVELVSSGQAPWAVPHGRVLRLSPATTADWLGRLEADTAELPEVDLEALARPAYAGFPGGGVFVVPRAVYEAAGGIPSVFRGWGSEDQAIGAILDCFAGPHVRGSADLVHLWHEPQPTKGMVTGNHQRYAAIAAAAKQGRDPLLRALQHYAKPMPAKPTAPGGRSWADRASQQQDRKRGYLAERGKPGAP